jgi:hypothetical protein
MGKTSAFLFPAVALCLLAGAVALTMALILPPAPLPVDAPTCTSGDKCRWAAEFSAGRAAGRRSLGW